jgi:porin
MTPCHSPFPFRCAPLLALLALIFPPKASAVQGPWTVGVEATAEGGTRLRNTNGAEHSTNGFILAHAAWAPASAPENLATITAYASVAGLFGVGPSEAFAGNLLTVSNIEGRRGARIYSWWIEGRRAEWSLRTGALLADEEFLGTESGAGFLNSAFGWPAFISSNTTSTGPAFYVPAIGIRLRHEFNETHYAQLGIYDGNTFDGLAPADESGRHGLRPRLSGSQGQFVIFEIGAQPKEGSTRLKFGGWVHTADFDDLWADSSGRSFALTGTAPRSHHFNYGGFAALEHTLLGKPAEPGNLTGHLRAGFSPADRNAVGWAADAGVAWLGPLASRSGDTLSLGVAYLRHGDHFVRGQREANPSEPPPDFEAVAEAAYSAILSDHLTLHPSVQYIRHPGGSSAKRDAVLGLLRLVARF